MLKDKYTIGLHPYGLAFPARVLLLLTITMLINTAQAGQYHAHESIRQAVKTHLLSFHEEIKNKKISIGKLDPRLRLVQCKNQPETFFLPGSKTAGNTTIGVRCSTPKNWTVYVPANVKIYKPVVVSRKSLPRNKLIEPEDLKTITKEVSGINSGYFTQAVNLVGKLTRRAIPPDYLFSANSVKAPRLVKRGEDVSIIVKSAGFKIRVAGVALMDGSKQEKIKVKNKASKKVLDAIVTSRGVVSIRM